MPANYDVVRRLALGFPGVAEGQAYGTPSLHVGKKLMARLREDGETLVIKIDPADRIRYFEAAPDTFFITDHYQGHPVMLVNLPGVRTETLSALVEGAWRLVAPKRSLAAWAARFPER